MNESDNAGREQLGPQKRVDEEWKKQIEREKDQAEARTQARRPKGQRPEPQAGPQAAPGTAPEGSRFAEFVAGLAMQAMMAIGEMPNPRTGVTAENLGEAKYLIDTLAMLQEKTKGNLTQEEAAAFEETIYSLRMVYVRKVSGPGQPRQQQ